MHRRILEGTLWERPPSIDGPPIGDMRTDLKNSNADLTQEQLGKTESFSSLRALSD